MSVPARSLPGGAAFRARWGLSAVPWVAIASLVALLQATATVIGFKLGIAVALALIVGAVVMARPVLLLSLAAMTIFVESLTFSGMAVTRLLAPGALLVALAELLRGTGRLRVGLPLMWVGAYVAWAVASGLWTASLDGTRFLLQSLAIALVFMLAFATLLNSEEDLRQLLYVLAFTAALVGGLSVLAFRGGLEIPHLDLLQAGRSQGGVGDPDFFAAMQLVAVPLVLVLASETEDRRLRLGLYGALLAILASVFTSLSRGGFIGVLVLGLLLVASRPERLFRSRYEKALALLVVALGMVVLFSRPFVREEIVDRAETIYAPKTKEDETGSGRTNLWKAAARTAAEHPALGVGYGSFMFISQELILGTPGVDLEVYNFREEGENLVAHSIYLGTAAELGFTGLLLYLGVMISTGVALRRTAVRAVAVGAPFVGRVAHALLLGLVSWAVTSAFLSGETARMFWIIVGLSLALPKLLPEPERAGLGREPAPAGYLARSNAPMS